MPTKAWLCGTHADPVRFKPVPQPRSTTSNYPRPSQTLHRNGYAYDEASGELRNERIILPERYDGEGRRRPDAPQIGDDGYIPNERPRNLADRAAGSPAANPGQYPESKLTDGDSEADTGLENTRRLTEPD